MLSFLKDLFGKIDHVKVSKNSDEISYEELTGQKEDLISNTQADDKEIQTELSLHPDWDEKLDHEQKYVLNFIHSKLPTIKKAIFFHAFHVEPIRNGYSVTLFIRNGLDKTLRLTDVPFKLINSGKIVASGKFSFEKMGEIPAGSSRPWTIQFTGDMVFELGIEKFKTWGVKVGYRKPIKVKPHNLQLTKEWNAKLSKGQKDALLNLLKKMPPVPLNRVEYVPIEVSITDEKEIITTILIRNGYKVEVQLKNTPLLLIDKERGHVAAGVFDMAGLTIMPGASLPWNFHFKKEDIINEDFDKHKLEVIHGAKQIKV